MNIQQLGNTLKKEFLRNKKKSAVLGLLAVVALYFWAPLVGGWFSGDDADESVEIAELTPAAPSPTPAVASTQKQTKPQLSWKKLLEQKKTNPLMASAVLNDLVRNPFSQMLKTKEQNPKLKELLNEPRGKQPPVELSLDDLKLQLTGTIIGQRQSWATINGRTYKINGTIQARRPGAAASKNKETKNVEESSDTLEFELTEIHRDSVVLKRGNNEYTLKLIRRGSGGETPIIVHKPSTTA